MPPSCLHIRGRTMIMMKPLSSQMEIEGIASGVGTRWMNTAPGDGLVWPHGWQRKASGDAEEYRSLSVECSELQRQSANTKIKTIASPQKGTQQPAKERESLHSLRQTPLPASSSSSSSSPHHSYRHPRCSMKTTSLPPNSLPPTAANVVATTVSPRSAGGCPPFRA